jgi:hypothetical protein
MNKLKNNYPKGKEFLLQIFYDINTISKDFSSYSRFRIMQVKMSSKLCQTVKKAIDTESTAAYFSGQPAAVWR